ncbi:MAG: hypothetical protein ACH36H_02045 [Candidatus Nanopelagicales bacterium]
MTEQSDGKRPYVSPAMPRVVGAAAEAENAPVGAYSYYADLVTYTVSI